MTLQCPGVGGRGRSPLINVNMRTYLHFNQASQRLKNPTGAEFDTLKWKDRFGVQTEKQHQGSVSFTVQETHRLSVQMSAESHASVRKLVENRWHARQPTQLIRKPWPIVNKKGGFYFFFHNMCDILAEHPNPGTLSLWPAGKASAPKLIWTTWHRNFAKSDMFCIQRWGPSNFCQLIFISFLRILRKPLRNHEKSIAWTYSFRIFRYLPHAGPCRLRKFEKTGGLGQRSQVSRRASLMSTQVGRPKILRPDKRNVTSGCWLLKSPSAHPYTWHLLTK